MHSQLQSESCSQPPPVSVLLIVPPDPLWPDDPGLPELPLAPPLAGLPFAPSFPLPEQAKPRLPLPPWPAELEVSPKPPNPPKPPLPPWPPFATAEMNPE